MRQPRHGIEPRQAFLTATALEGADGDVVVAGEHGMVVAVLLPQVQGMAVKRLDGLRELYPRLLSLSALRLGAREVMNFLWCKLVGNIRAEVVFDLSSLVCRRVGGSRIKYRVKQNWLKTYDKAGLVLRIETVSTPCAGSPTATSAHS